MVQFQSSIMKIDLFVVRLPVENYDQVNQTHSKHQVKPILTYVLNQYVASENNL